MIVSQHDSTSTVTIVYFQLWFVNIKDSEVDDTHTLLHIHSFSFVRSSLINSFWELGWKKDGNCFKTNKRYDHKSIPYRIVSFTHYYWSSLLNGSDHFYAFPLHISFAFDTNKDLLYQIILKANYFKGNFQTNLLILFKISNSLEILN